MKQMEYTIKVVTETPVDTAVLKSALTEIIGVATAEITNYRVLPARKAPKPEAVRS
jgi:hypothetical protein